MSACVVKRTIGLQALRAFVRHPVFPFESNTLHACQLFRRSEPAFSIISLTAHRRLAGSPGILELFSSHIL